MIVLKMITFWTLVNFPVRSINSREIHGENMVIALDEISNDLDALEMIKPGRENALINQKLENFHNYVRKNKIMKRPWEKLFIKNVEYRKSEMSYAKMLQDTIKKMKGFNESVRKRKLKHATTGIPFGESNNSLIEKRQLEKSSGGSNNDDDDDDDDDDYTDDTKSNKFFLPQLNINLGQLKQKYLNLTMMSNPMEIFRYSNQGKPEESIQEAFKKIIDIKVPENCTNITGFGIQSVECLLNNYKSHEMSNKQLFMKAIKIFLTWVEIYIFVALPLWCTKGWGCCCFRCDFCHPMTVVKEVQKYVAENPPGVYINDEGEEEHYAPSIKEKELYDKINKSIMQF